MESPLSDKLSATMEHLPDPNTLTPVMQQWRSCKERAGSSILLFRMGDFYEAFYDDAVIIARELELALTKRQEAPMSGIPAHVGESYIDRLVAKGYRVAIAEQIADSAKGKGLISREIVRVVTPGTTMGGSLVSEGSNQYIVALTQVGALFGLAALDMTTAEFRVAEFSDFEQLSNELHRLRPAEFIATPRLLEKYGLVFKEFRGQRCALHPYEAWHFEHQQAYNYLSVHFKVISLDGFGVRGMVAGINAAGGLLHYIREGLSQPIDHIESLMPYSTDQTMALDRHTQRHLELTENLSDGGKRNTLLAVLDRTHTPMGARLLRRWVKHPLLDVKEINTRQDSIESLYRDHAALLAMRTALEGIRDLERLTMRVVTGYAGPRDLVALRFSLEALPALCYSLNSFRSPSPEIANSLALLAGAPPVASLIATALVDEPPLRVTDGACFREGYHAELDELRRFNADSKLWMMDYQTRLRDETGIKTLKVGYNRVSGYYLEVSRGQADRTPLYFERRQTLTNAERFVTEELKEFERKTSTAEEKSLALENELFAVLKRTISAHSQRLQEIAQAIAYVDCCASLAQLALDRRYVRPLVDSSPILEIKGGRHPVVEAVGGMGCFTPNDTAMGSDEERLLIITGPNMAGKSTYIRQVALISLLAQIGSFVPAESAHIGIIDKIFTRIGASDDLSRGLSTFMVEMAETAQILHGATEHSLVILDEIGRGTSTYDGISIAWAVAEHLLTLRGNGPKTLFATHYWELTQLEGVLPGAVNYSVAVHEAQGQIHFLHKIVKGAADKSYGIHVARLAGLPLEVISRSHEILQHLESQSQCRAFTTPPKAKLMKGKSPKVQQPVFVEGDLFASLDL